MKKGIQNVEYLKAYKEERSSKTLPKITLSSVEKKYEEESVEEQEEEQEEEEEEESVEEQSVGHFEDYLGGNNDNTQAAMAAGAAAAAKEQEEEDKTDFTIKLMGEDPDPEGVFKIYIEDQLPDLEPIDKPSIVDISVEDATKSGKRIVFSSTEDESSFNYKMEVTEKKGGSWFLKSKEATLFVFPDGTYGSKGYRNWIIEPKKGKQLLQITSTPTIKLKSELIKAIKPARADEKRMLKNLSKFSSKYENVIRDILDHPKQLIFIYCSSVKGSGALLFSKILELFGFSRSYGKRKGSGKQYSILTSQTDRSIDRIIDTFNRSENMYGDNIQVIIGSRKISEGISLMNVQRVHVLTPHWNYSETEQAIARALRAYSHDDLKEEGVDVDVQIFLHSSIPRSKSKDKDRIDENSVDNYMYIMSAIKDIAIKRIESVLKKVAIDCSLTYDRNFRNEANNGDRDCDYTECSYKCDDIESLELDKSQLDYTTNNLYYTNEVRDEIIEIVKKMFETRFKIELEEFKRVLSNYTLYQIINVLYYIISNRIVIKNKYNIDSYLKESNNTYFLVNDMFSDGSNLLSYYNEFPTIKHKINEEEIINEYLSRIGNIITETFIFNSSFYSLSSKKQIQIIQSLRPDIQEDLLEKVIKIYNESGENLELYNLINTIYSEVLETNETFIISSLLKPELRCFNIETKVWDKCPKSLIKKTKEDELSRFIRLQNNDFGFYLIFNKSNKKYKLRRVISEIDRSGPGNTSTKGKDV